MNKIYSTAAAKMFRGLNEVARSGIDELIGVEFRESESMIKLGKLATPSYENEDFPFFPFPVSVSLDNNNRDPEKIYTLVDLRPFYNTKGEPRDIINREMVKEQAALIREWDLTPSTFDHTATFVSAVFAHWISAALKTNFSLDINEVATVRTVAAIYYAKLFIAANEHERKLSPEDRRDEVARNVLSMAASRKLWNSVEQVNVVLEAEEMQAFLVSDEVELGSLLSALSTMLSANSSARMARLTEGNFLSIMSRGAWLGYKAGPIVGAALEFPPLLIHFINVASNSRQLRDKTVIGRAFGVLDKDTSSVQTITRLVSEIKNEYTI